MSDDTDNEDEKDKGKKGKGEEPRPLSEPVPKDLKLFEWLESLFYSENQSPEKIELNSVWGARKQNVGPTLDQKFFAPDNASATAAKKMEGKSRKPTRETLVALTNAWLNRMQGDCDELGQVQTYGLHAWRFTTDDQAYSRYVKTMKPSGRVVGRARPGLDSDDDEAMPLRDRHSLQVLEHGQKMFDMYASALQGMCQLLTERVDADAAERRELHARIAQQNEMMERALSLQAERDERREWAKTKREAAQRGLDLAFQVVPPLISGLLPKGRGGGAPDQPSLEALTLQNFFKLAENGGSLTAEQANATFGIWNGEQLVTPGILTKDQSVILYSVAFHNVPVEELDKLMPGGPCQISMEQFGALQKVFSMDQLAPLWVLFESRQAKKKREEKPQ